MLLTITTTGKVTLSIVAALFIAWALITAIWIPKRNPDFPSALTGFLLVSVAFFALQMGAIYWVTATQEVEKEATSGETTTAEATTSEAGTTTEAATTSEAATTTEAATTSEATTTTAGQGDAAAGKQVFETAGCANCHTLADAGASGSVGPNLDDAKPSYDLVVERVTNGKGVMPSFSGNLSEQQIMDVAAYVSSVAGA
jgi:mono/diheme cytochrome c family protein